MTMHPHILKLDIGGLPVEWVTWQAAATLYARDRVRWEAGDQRILLRGGRRADGTQSTMTINTIIAVHERSRKYDRAPPLTNAALFRRDGHLCMYCGVRHRPSELTRDHVVPTSRGGRDVWTNVLSACKPCNNRKDDRTPEEARMLPLALPFAPNYARYLLLIASGRVTGDQQAFLESLATTGRTA